MATRLLERHTPALIPPDPILPNEGDNLTATYSIDIQTGYQDWAALRILDESNQRQWTPDEELLVKQVSDQLSLALENARLFREAQERAEELALINRVIGTLTGANNLRDALDTVIYEIVEAFPVARGAVALLNEDKQNLSVIADHSKVKDGSSAIGLKIPLEGNLATQTVITSHKPYILENASDNPAASLPVQEEFRRLGITYAAIFPIIINDQVIGTLGVDMVEKGARLNFKPNRFAGSNLVPDFGRHQSSACRGSAVQIRS